MQTNENTRLPASIAARIQGAQEQANHAGCSGAGVSCFDVDGGLYLKTDEPGRLAREATMQAYLHSKGFTPEVLAYETGARDFLLSRRARGETAIFPAYLAEPARLAAELGRAARRLHETAADDCPIRGLSAEWLGVFERSRSENRSRVSAHRQRGRGLPVRRPARKSSQRRRADSRRFLPAQLHAGGLSFHRVH